MNAITLTCPHCSSKLTVSAAAPRVVTCPRCLYRLINPSAGQAEVALPVPPLPTKSAPMKVLPLESQAQNDAGAILTMLVVLLAMLMAGAFVTAATAGVGGGMFNILLVLILMAFTAIVIVASVRRQKHDQAVAEAVSKMPQLPPEEQQAIAYQSPAKWNPYQSEPTNGFAAAGGFFAAIGLCAGGFFLLAATSALNKPSSANADAATRGFLLLIVVVAVVSFMIGTPMLSRRPGWKGFGLGATIGLVLGMLALGPCAFCYLLTLGG